MGKKKRKDNKPWCWYCDREFDDEKVLIDHQRIKHFKCTECHKKLNTAGGMVVHMSQVHKQSCTAVCNAIPGRDSVDIEIFGMEGVPESDLQAHIEKLAGGGNSGKRQKVDVGALTPAEIQRQMAEFKKHQQEQQQQLLNPPAAPPAQQMHQQQPMGMPPPAMPRPFPGMAGGPPPPGPYGAPQFHGGYPPPPQGFPPMGGHQPYGMAPQYGGPPPGHFMPPPGQFPPFAPFPPRPGMPMPPPGFPPHAMPGMPPHPGMLPQGIPPGPPQGFPMPPPGMPPFSGPPPPFGQGPPGPPPQQWGPPPTRPLPGQFGSPHPSQAPMPDGPVMNFTPPNSVPHPSPAVLPPHMQDLQHPLPPSSPSQVGDGQGNALAEGTPALPVAPSSGGHAAPIAAANSVLEAGPTGPIKKPSLIVYSDNEISVEEKRALHPKYAFQEDA